MGAENSTPLGWASFEGLRVVLAELAEEEEEQDGVKVTQFEGSAGVWRRDGGLEEAGEVMEGGEEVAGDEEGFMGERDGVEVVEGVGEDSWGGEKRGEAEVVVAENRVNAASQV